MVAACISAETGVGPSMASGNQICNGNWEDLAMAPKNKPTPANVNTVPPNLPAAIPSKISEKTNVPNDEKISMMPMKKPMSPTRLVKNAFLAASEAESFSNQWPINR